MDFEKQKVQIKIPKKNYDTLSKNANPHYAIYPQTVSLKRTHPTARCTVLSFFFIQIYRQRRDSFPE